MWTFICILLWYNLYDWFQSDESCHFSYLCTYALLLPYLWLGTRNNTTVMLFVPSNTIVLWGVMNIAANGKRFEEQVKKDTDLGLVVLF